MSGDLHQLNQEEERGRGRKRIVIAIYAAIICAVCALYFMILSVLSSIQEKISAHKVDVPVQTLTSGSESERVSDSTAQKSFVLNPPALQKGDLSGEAKLSSVMRFCSRYSLEADKCQGDFETVAQLTDLECFSAHDTLITDADLRAIRKLPLRSINIGQCPNVHKEGLMVLQSMPTLRNCCMSQCNIGDADVGLLNPNIKELWLEQCNLTDEAVPKLLKLKNLWQLRLAGNKISARSFKYVKQMKNLYCLDLRSNPAISKAEILKLLSDMPATIIHWDSWQRGTTGSIDSSDLHQCVAHSNGIELQTDGAHGDFSEIGKLKQLEDVALPRSTVRDADLSSLEHLPLRSIKLEQCNIHGAGLKYLKHIPTLIAFQANNSGLRDADLEELNPNLIELNLSDCKITDAGIKTLTRLRRLKVLQLGSDLITTKSFDILRSMKSLKNIDVHHCPNISLEQSKQLEDSISDCVVLMNKTKY